MALHVSAPAAEMNRRTVLKGIAALFGSASAAAAENGWTPSGTVRLIVPFSPGGAADVLGRIIAPGMRQQLKQTVVVENKVGATGSIGADYVFSAPSDGQVLLIGNADGLSMYPHVAKTRFVATELVPVGPLARTPFILMGREDLPADDLKGLVALAQSRALTYSSAGAGSSMHVLTSAFKTAAKIGELVHVPYAGAAPALQALVAGQVDLMMVPTAIVGSNRARLKSFGVTSATRFDYVKEISTLTELGIPVVGESWLGVLAPPNTRPAIVSALSGALDAVVSSGDYRERVAQMGMAPIDLEGVGFAKYYQEQYCKWGAVIQAENIRAD